MGLCRIWSVELSFVRYPLISSRWDLPASLLS